MIPLLILAQLSLSQGGPLISDALLNASGAALSDDGENAFYRSIGQARGFKDSSTATLIRMTRDMLRYGHVELYCKIRRELLGRSKIDGLPSNRVVSWKDLLGLLRNGVRRNSDRIPRCFDAEIALQILEYTEQNPVRMMAVVSDLSLIFLRHSDPSLLKRLAVLIPIIYPRRLGPTHDRYTTQLALRSAVLGLPAIARKLAKRNRSKRDRAAIGKTLRYLSRAPSTRPKRPHRSIVGILLRTYLAQENARELATLFEVSGCADDRVKAAVNGIHKLADPAALIAQLQQCKPSGDTGRRLRAAELAGSNNSEAIATKTLDIKLRLIDFELQRQYFTRSKTAPALAHQVAAAISAEKPQALLAVINSARTYGDRNLLCKSACRFPADAKGNVLLAVTMAGCGKIAQALKIVAASPKGGRSEIYGEMARAVILGGFDKPLSTYPQSVQDAL
jgi:hypothetical protein